MVTQHRKHRGYRSQALVAEWFAKRGHVGVSPVDALTGIPADHPLLVEDICGQLIPRLLDRISVQSSGCWLWMAGHNGKGYGRIRIGKTRRPLTYGVMYRLVIGPVPPGLVLDHLCRNRGCVNPWHLEAVTSWENTMRGDGLAARFAARTHCANGHEFSDVNTFKRTNGGRGCRACLRAAHDRAQRGGAA